MVGGLVEGESSFSSNNLLMGRVGGLVMGRVIGLVKGGAVSFLAAP